jgi:catechol 2,3-dioxygenase-like lactoylglutathione lyase family enzyme
MKIHIASVFVDDQDKALKFYTEVLGFVKKTELPLGEARWLTVVSPDDPGTTELLLEPDDHPAVRPFKQALVQDGIPFTSLAVDDVDHGIRAPARDERALHASPGDAGPCHDSCLRRRLRQPDSDRRQSIGRQA